MWARSVEPFAEQREFSFQFPFGIRFGDPELLYDGFGEIDFEDSLAIRLHKLFGQRDPGFRFHYEYDFGDGWEHDVAFEGQFPRDPKAKFPVCIGGERARPPEDCGGSRGYERLLEELANPTHTEYEHLRKWAGDFSPVQFSLDEATRAMQAGLPDWRSEPWEI